MCFYLGAEVVFGPIFFLMNAHFRKLLIGIPDIAERYKWQMARAFYRPFYLTRLTVVYTSLWFLHFFFECINCWRLHFPLYAQLCRPPRCLPTGTTWPVSCTLLIVANKTSGLDWKTCTTDSRSLLCDSSSFMKYHSHLYIFSCGIHDFTLFTT